MKIIINYDFMDAVLNARYDEHPLFKVVRRRKNLLMAATPAWLGQFYIYNGNDPVMITSGMIVSYMIATGLLLAVDKYYDDDVQRRKALNDLRLLVSQMNSLNFNTNLNLLLQSQVYEKKLKIEFNEEKLPHLLQQKYILIPTYDYKGEVKETSFVQEHVVGSKEYVLSLGTPSRKRQVKLATAGA